MDVLMPTFTLDSEALSECRENVDLDDFFLAKLAYINCSSDLDVFQLQGNERIKHLIYAWDTGSALCRSCDTDGRKYPDFLQNFLVNLVHYSMSLWFSLEWEKCDFDLCCNLLVSMYRMRPNLMGVPCLVKLDWKNFMNIGVRPWQNAYFKKNIRTFGIIENNTSSSSSSSTTVLTSSVETTEPSATICDIEHINQEGLVITLLRLMKLFDAGCMDSVKRFSICAISAWNQEQEKISNCSTVSYDIDLKRCLNMICHTHLMAVFERDSAVGFEIDNMINNIRFYHKCIRDAQVDGKSLDNYSQKAHITPSHLLALTCVRLGQSVQDFIESVLPDLSRESCSTLFGAVSHAYATYLLASILVDMNKFNSGDFIANVDKYKRTMRSYVVERERSERFILEELNKQKLQGTSHNVTCTVKEITNLKAAIGKGNHSSNLVNHKPSDVQSEQERAELFETQNEKRYDPVFQTMPNNEIVTNEFYDVLLKTKYKGWHFAKLVLLLKIIGRELNDIEKWCYHPGLTTQFMISLEDRLAKHFEHLALIFQDHIFMEQEFWLTAFYLRPVRMYYDKVIYCGTRFFRTVNFLNKGDRDEVILKPTDKSVDKNDEVSCAFMNAKYGLLSSTFDVKQIAQMTCVDTAENDYESLAKALRKLRLPENIIKDLLTVTFSPRHANFTWAAEWPILRKRCKMLLTNTVYKRELVESNMAEANDRLKYLKVDYDKYKNWPQLDYGSIEEGYENDYIGDDLDDSSDEYELDEDVHKKKGRTRRNQNKENEQDDDSEHIENLSIARQLQENLNELETGGNLKRSSARRAAAVIASAMLKEDYNSKVIKKKDIAPTTIPIAPDKPDNFATESEKETIVDQPTDEAPMSNSNALVNELFRFTNSTVGFIPIADLWKHDKHVQNESQSLPLEEASTQKVCGILKNVKDLCIKVNTEEEIDESSSDTESFEAHSTHEAMNVSDTETSDSSTERSQDGWEQLLPSFIVENNARAQTLTPSDIQVPLSNKKNEENEESEENELSDEEEESDDKEKNEEKQENMVNADKEKQNLQSKLEEQDEKEDSKEYDNKVEQKDLREEKETKEQNVSTSKSEDKLLSASKSKDEIQTENQSKENIIQSHVIIQSVEIYQPNTVEASRDTIREENTASPFIAQAHADCIDTIAEQNTVELQSTNNEKNKNEEFAVSTTTTTTNVTQELSNDVPQDETETAIDSTVCLKTEEHKSIDEVASIATVTEDNSHNDNKNESEKGEVEAEVHSTTQNEIQPYNKQLTGKPKSFSEILSTQLTSEDSSQSQSSNGTPVHSILCRALNNSEIAESDVEEKRKAELIQLCLHKKCFVSLKRMNPIRPTTVREPIVRLKRLNLDRLIKEKTVRQKRSKSKPKYFYMEDNPSPVPQTNKARKRRSDTPLCSESDEEYKPKQSKDSIRPANRKILLIKKTMQGKHQRARVKSFSVVPRSASGLKVCISSLCDIRPPTDCIEISSSSEGDIMEVANFPVEFADIGSLIADEDDPLFEEEADIDLLR